MERAVIQARRARCRACPQAVPCRSGRLACTCAVSGDSLRRITAAAEEACPEGRWVAHKSRVRNGRSPTAEQIARAHARAAICAQCEHNRGVTLTRNGWNVYRTRCQPCGCAGLSLVHGDCPLERWDC